MRRDVGATLRQLLTLRVPLYDENMPFVLLWSQKAGCTTLAKWFFEQLGLLDAALRYNSWVHRYETEVFKRRSGYMDRVRTALRERRVPVVKVVRDPAVRAASGFLVIGEARAASEPDHWARRHYDGARAWVRARDGEGESGPGLSFVEHLRCLADIESSEPFSCDPHLAPQHIPGEEAFIDLVVPIGHFFAFAHALSASDPKVAPPAVARLSANDHHHRVTRCATRRIGRPESYRLTLGAFGDGHFPDARAFVNRRTRLAIGDAFARDLAAYGEICARPFSAEAAVARLQTARRGPRPEGHLSTP